MKVLQVGLRRSADTTRAADDKQAADDEQADADRAADERVEADVANHLEILERFVAGLESGSPAKLDRKMAQRAAHHLAGALDGTRWSGASAPAAAVGAVLRARKIPVDRLTAVVGELRRALGPLGPHESLEIDNLGAPAGVGRKPGAAGSDDRAASQPRGRVLVVDDDEAVAQRIADGLASAGMVGVLARNGPEALDRLTEATPDLIVCEVMIAEMGSGPMGGFELLARLRSDAVGRNVPLIFLTTSHDPDSVLTGFTLGADDYLTKPFHLDELIGRVKARIDRPDVPADLLGRNRQRFRTDTGLLQEFDKELARSGATGRPGAVAVLALDELSDAGDHDGPRALNALVAHVSQLLQRGARPLEQVGYDGRSGFTLLLPETTPDEARRRLRRLAEMLGRAVLSGAPEGVSVTPCLGYATWGGAEEAVADAGALHERALAAVTSARERSAVEPVVWTPTAPKPTALTPKVHTTRITARRPTPAASPPLTPAPAAAPRVVAASTVAASTVAASTVAAAAPVVAAPAVAPPSEAAAPAPPAPPPAPVEPADLPAPSASPEAPTLDHRPATSVAPTPPVPPSGPARRRARLGGPARVLVTVLAAIGLPLGLFAVGHAIWHKGGHPSDTRLAAPQARVTAPVVTQPSAAPTSVPGPAPAAVAPTTLQIKVVPAVRDLLFSLDGRVVATDAEGSVRLDGVTRPIAVEVLGYSVSPSLQQVEVDRWSDGPVDARRTVDVRGPTLLELGVRIRHRVEVRLDPPAPAGATVSVRMSSPAGDITLSPGVPTWVLAERSMPAGALLSPDDLTYTVESATAGSANIPVQHTRLTPAAEAYWTVHTG